ncbi:transmembrane protein 26 [Bombus vancouverensis nearcticus]|uniref:Transmembrane protein 26 n=1 Tax=Bombus bifarius TaxID=103933 RepID=A0A6P8NPN3_9HYME|nr:transmembrane protein 26 [Bombus vancouverensis nearcticus]XP_033316395.1 transmembrane protein 26 [Bombus bifarius]
MAKFLATIKAIITRLVFASHGFIAIWQVTTFKKNPLFWYLSCPILLLFFEGIFTLTIKENQEWKWFCPSVFLYLSSVVPAIWLLELDKVDRRMKTFETNVNISENFDLTNLAAEDLKHLEKAFGVNINLPDIKISTETWVTLIEQFLMLILIIGRWMLPKGELTRDQLSQLLLVYIGTAADIIEFFDSFKEDRIAREPVLVYLTLGIWAWSLMQFTVVLTATKSRKSRLSSGNAVKKRAHTETSCCSIDVWGIALNMLLQDGPFLSFRLILIVHYRIVSYMNIFFTCKNTLVILLQLYRLYVVQTENRSKIKKKSEVPSISIISKEDMYKDVKGKRISEERRRKRRRDKDIEANYSDSEETTEEADKFDSSPRNIRHSRRKTRQDTGYSTSSSKNSGRHRKSQRGDSKKKSSREESTKIEISSDEDKRRKRIDKRSSVKRDRKLSESIKMKTRNEDSSKSSSKSRKCKEDSEEDESTTEEVADKIVSQESESESERKRYVHRKRRQNRD